MRLPRARHRLFGNPDGDRALALTRRWPWRPDAAAAAWVATWCWWTATPLLPPGEVRSLLAPGTDRFYNSIGEVLRAVARGRFRADEIEAEAEAQLTRLQRASIAISHFDTHKHTHMFPSILRPLLRAARAQA